MRGIHQFSKLINRLKRLCVYFYYGANKSGSRAMWVLRQSDAISGFFYGKQCAQYPEFSWLKKIHHNMFVCFIVYIEKYIILYSKWQLKAKNLQSAKIFGCISVNFSFTFLFTKHNFAFNYSDEWLRSLLFLFFSK